MFLVKQGRLPTMDGMFLMRISRVRHYTIIFPIWILQEATQKTNYNWPNTVLNLGGIALSPDAEML